MVKIENCTFAENNEVSELAFVGGRDHALSHYSSVLNIVGRMDLTCQPSQTRNVYVELYNNTFENNHNSTSVVIVDCVDFRSYDDKYVLWNMCMFVGRSCFS